MDMIPRAVMGSNFVASIAEVVLDPSHIMIPIGASFPNQLCAFALIGAIAAGIHAFFD